MDAEAAAAEGQVRHWTADVNGISLHVAERGAADAPAVLLIHGFPELWLSWRHQMAALAARGFRALAPDLRGYGDSSVPTDPAAYSILHIVGDLVALLDHLQLTKVPPFFPRPCSCLSLHVTIESDRTAARAVIWQSAMDGWRTCRCSWLGTTGARWWRGTSACSGRTGCAPLLSWGLGIPYFPRGPRPMTDSFAKLGDGFYINQFQVEISFLSLAGPII
jgi:hypothetical protein